MAGKGMSFPRCALWVVLTTTTAIFASAPAAVVHVDADAGPGGDGETWQTAYRFLQDGLARAAGIPEPSVEIRIAGGTYRPDRDEMRPNGSHRRTDTFTLLDGVTLRGGYAGLGAPDPDARDVVLYETVLSGDLGANDGPNFFGYLENSYHVVTAIDVGPTAVLDGITVASGHANGTPGIDDVGAGVLCYRGAPTFNECIIRANLTAFQGGGVQCRDGSAPRFTNCELSGNRALDNGGAMYNGASSPIMVDCAFRFNTGRIYAGGVCNRDLSNARFERCEFFANFAAEDESLGGGGGAMVNASSHPDVIDCTFTSNAALFGKGGAMVNEPGLVPELGGSAPIVTGSTFGGNVAMLGGAIYNEESDPLTVGCAFTANRTQDAYGRNAGGAIYNGESDARTEDCVFTGNRAARGGAVYNNLGGAPVFERCTFTGNEAVSDAGGGISNYYAAATVIDCVFEGNAAATGGGAFQNFIAEATMIRCTIAGNTSGTDGGGIYNIDSTITIEDCALSANAAPGAGGAMFNGQGSEAVLAGCTVSGNAAAAGGGAHNHALSTLAVSQTMCCENTPDDFDGDYEDHGGNEFHDECPAPCPADLDGSGGVDFQDILAVLGAWGPCPACPEDLDGDGRVDFADLLVVLGAWGDCA